MNSPLLSRQSSNKQIIHEKFGKKVRANKQKVLANFQQTPNFSQNPPKLLQKSAPTRNPKRSAIEQSRTSSSGRVSLARHTYIPHLPLGHNAVSVRVRPTSFSPLEGAAALRGVGSVGPHLHLKASVVRAASTPPHVPAARATRAHATPLSRSRTARLTVHLTASARDRGLVDATWRHSVNRG